MQTKLIIAVMSALATPAIAAPDDSPYALRAVHADFQAQLEKIAATPGTIGIAGRVAADLMAAQNAAQERLVLPLLDWADAPAADLARIDPVPWTQALRAEMPRLAEGDVALVTALVELYAAAEEAGQPAIALVAERMIWHETSDVEILYPAALLISERQPQAFAKLFAVPTTPGPLYGSGPFPMMGVGNPHPTATGN